MPRSLQVDYMKLAFLCELEDAAAIAQMVQDGARLDWCPEGEDSLIDKCARAPWVEGVRLLLKHGVQATQADLFEVWDEDVLDALLCAGANPCKESEHGWTLLHQACSLGRAPLALCLLRHGANHEAKDRDGYTPLRVARELRPDLADLLQSHLTKEQIDRATATSNSPNRPRRI